MVFFFYGANSFASRRKLREMVATYIAKTGGDLGLERMDGQTATGAVISNALGAVPFLVSSRLVVIENLGANKTVSGQVPDLIKAVPETTVVVFYESAVDQRTVYFKSLSSMAKVAKFENLNSIQLSKWIKAEVEKLSGQIEPSAINRLIEIVGDDQWRLEQEVIKLVNYCPKINVEAVNALVVQTPQQTIFDLVEAMSGKRVKTALVIFRDLVAQRTSEVYILNMIMWQLRSLLLAKTAGPMTQAELSRATGMSPYVSGKALVRQRDFLEEDLRRAFLAAVEADYELKSGQGAPEQLVERLIYRVATGAV